MASPELPADPGSFLSRHAPFDRLSPCSLAALEEGLEIRYAAAGEELLRRGGAPSDALWILRKGQVRLLRDGEILETLSEGDCFGYGSLLGRRSPLRDAVAVDDCLLFRVPAATFHRLLDEHEVARFFLESLATRLRGSALSSSLTAVTVSGSLGAPLRELARRPAATIPSTASAGEAARRMRELGIGSLLVTRCDLVPAGDGPLPRAALAGILTDRDLRNRVLAADRGPETPLVEILSRPVQAIDVSASSLDALLAMSGLGVRHLPVVDGERVVGMVTASDLVRLQTSNPLSLLRRVERRPLEEVAPGYAAEVRRAVMELVRAGVDPLRIGPLVATWNDALARRLLAGALAEVAGLEVAWVVHGSDGRREQLLPTDQDNALIWGRGPRAEPLRDPPAVLGLDPAFAGCLRSSKGLGGDGPTARAEPRDDGAAAAYLAERMVGGLIAAGFPPCPGGYMATRWHDPLDRWLERLGAWMEHPRPETSIDLCSFLDLRQVAGMLDLGPLLALRAAAGRHRHLLRILAQDCAAWSLPLGLFGGLREGEKGFDLKRGTLLIVAVARLFALEAGGAATSTLERLREAEPLLGADAETLAEAFRYLSRLRLEHALDARGPETAAAAELGASHRLHLPELNAMERRFLKDIFHFLRQLTAGLPRRYAL